MTAKRALLLGILFWSAYVGLRTLLQTLIPYHDWTKFAVQDIAISVLRLACGLGCLWVARKRWYDSALGLKFAAWPAALGWAAVAAALLAQLLGDFSQRPNWDEPLWIRAVELLIALIVAFNEEVGYRALLQGAIRELWGRPAAVVVSSLLFMAMHTGYQPSYHLPKILLLGFFFALLRDRGASLPLLIVTHFVMDSFGAIRLTSALENWPLYWASAGCAALAALFALLASPRFKAAGEALLFAYGTLRIGEVGAAAIGVARRCDVIGSGETEGRIADLNGYPALYPSKRGETVPGQLLRLRDHDYLTALDDYEGADYIRDKAFIQTSSGDRCEAWIYVASSERE